MLDPQDRSLAERVAQTLLIGRGLSGLLFRSGVELVFWGVEQPLEPLQAAVTVGGLWKIEMPGKPLPVLWQEHDDAGYLALAEFACLCRFVHVAAVHIDDAANLTLVFANHYRLVVSACDRYESWAVSGGPCMVLSTPGREIAVWTNLGHRSS